MNLSKFSSRNIPELVDEISLVMCFFTLAVSSLQSASFSGK